MISDSTKEFVISSFLLLQVLLGVYAIFSLLGPVIGVVWGAGVVFCIYCIMMAIINEEMEE